MDSLFQDPKPPENELEYWKHRAFVLAMWLEQAIKGDPTGVRRWSMLYESKRTVKEVYTNTPHIDAGFWKDCWFGDTPAYRAQMKTYEWVVNDESGTSDD